MPLITVYREMGRKIGEELNEWIRSFFFGRSIPHVRSTLQVPFHLLYTFFRSKSFKRTFILVFFLLASLGVVSVSEVVKTIFRFFFF